MEAVVAAPSVPTTIPPRYSLHRYVREGLFREEHGLEVVTQLEAHQRQRQRDGSTDQIADRLQQDLRNKGRRLCVVDEQVALHGLQEREVAGESAQHIERANAEHAHASHCPKTPRGLLHTQPQPHAHSTAQSHTSCNAAHGGSLELGSWHG